MDAKKEIATLKRRAKKCLSWFKKSDPTWNTHSYLKNFPDTPENRTKALKQFGDQIDRFIADVLPD